MSLILKKWGHVVVVGQINRKKSRDLMFVWLWCAKVYSLFLLYIQLYFAPTPSPPPSPHNWWHSQVTSYCHCYNSQSELTCRKKATKQRRAEKRVTFSFFLMLNSNKYIEMQWFLFYPFLLSRRVKKFFYSVSISFYFLLICVGSLAAIRTSWHGD